MKDENEKIIEKKEHSNDSTTHTCKMLKYSFTKVSGCKFGGQFITFNYDVDLSLKNEGNFREKGLSKISSQFSGS